MHILRAAALFPLFFTIACGASEAPGAQQGAPAGAMPPSQVEIVALTARPVEQSTEFVGTIKSRRSTNIQPQAEGFLTRIAVKSGDRVQAGSLLMEIDSRPQAAAISAWESMKAQREIDVTYARQEAERAKKLLDAGAGSQMDADRAANALKAAEAQVHTVDEQIRQARTELVYYRVTSPVAGVVGDVPVREGDRVTKSTPLTTVEANDGLELYVNVPVQQAPQLKTGLPVRLVDDAGKELTRSAISFVAPSVDTATQTVLAKVPIAAGNFRTSQFVRAQVIWSMAPTLTVPVTAVTRINGQFFVFVAEPSPQMGGALVARQRAVTLGVVRDNAYGVLDGLKEGEQLIVSGVQKIGDGAPVAPAPAQPAVPAPPASAPDGAPAQAPDAEKK